MAISSSELERITSRMPHSPDVTAPIRHLAIDVFSRLPLASAPTRERVEQIMKETRPDANFKILSE